MFVTTVMTSLHNPGVRDHENAAKTIALAKTAIGACESIVVNTSNSDSGCDYADKYIWTNGRNIGYGGALNLAAQEAQGDAMIYFSAKRSITRDPQWFNLILEPLRDPNCGMAGSVKPCQYSCIARRPSDVFDPQIHVQGGVFAIRTQVLRENPYNNYFPQVYSDVWQSWNLIKSGYYLADVNAVSAVEAGLASPDAMVLCDYREDAELDSRFEAVCRQASDINEHCRTLRDLAARANHVTEFGLDRGNSTIAFLAGRPKTMRCYDVDPSTCLDHITRLIPAVTDFKFQVGDSRVVVIEPTDLLFIDTDQNFDTLLAELWWNAGKVSRRIVCHDTQTFPGCMKAVQEFVERNHEWRILNHYQHNNGLTILERHAGWPHWRVGLW